MLRYLSYGKRNFNKIKDPISERFGWEFYAIVKGKVAPQIEGQSPLEPRNNCLWLTRPGLVYRWEAKGSVVTRYAFQFSHVPERLRQVFQDRDWLCRTLGESDVALIQNLADELWPHYHSPTELLDLYGEKALLTLSLLFLNDNDVQSQRPLFRREYQRVRQAEEWYLEEVHKRPTLEQVARHLRISTSQMRRDFQTIYNVSPTTIFRRLRLAKATRLLMNTDLKVDDIYPYAGFSNAVDFHRNFKREFGLSPYQWRRRLTTHQTGSNVSNFGQGAPNTPISIIESK